MFRQSSVVSGRVCSYQLRLHSVFCVLCSVFRPQDDPSGGVQELCHRAESSVPGSEAVVGRVHGVPVYHHADDRSVRMHPAGETSKPTLHLLNVKVLGYSGG